MALLPPQWLSAVVALGVPGPPERWIATGFLYLSVLERLQQDDGGSEARGHAYLVTNRHVAVGHDRLLVRVNPVADTEAAQSFDLLLRREDGSDMWFAHPDPSVDVAVVPINAQVMRDSGMKIAYFHSDGGALRAADMKEKGVFEGDGAFILGFPMAMVGGNRNVAIVRTGAIARISDLLSGATNEYLVDAQVFPGNSGGPVIIKPEIVSIGDTKTLDARYLIGIVKSYVPGWSGQAGWALPGSNRRPARCKRAALPKLS